MPVIEGSGYRTLTSAGVPGAGTDAVQTLTIGGTPTGGTFKLKFEGLTTAAITWSATDATLLSNMNTALDAKYGTGNLVATAGTVSSGIGTVLITAAANRTKQPIGAITVANNSLTGTSPTLAMANTTPGVAAFGRGMPKGSSAIDTTNGIHYTNTGTALAPTWTKTGTQT